MLIPLPPGAFLPLLLVSFLAGILFGALYDLFRIRRLALRLACRPDGTGSRISRPHGQRLDTVLCFFEDLLFCLFATVVLILVDYRLYYGVPRWYAYGATVAGFALYRVTVGRLVMGSAKALLHALRAGVLWCRRRLLHPARKAVVSGVSALRRRIAKWRARFYTVSEERRILAVLDSAGPPPLSPRKDEGS